MAYRHIKYRLKNNDCHNALCGKLNKVQSIVYRMKFQYKFHSGQGTITPEV
nr:MAG TPA: hypothetical protein [Caudoviricetes sp.]